MDYDKMFIQACKIGDLDLAKVLLDKGADIYTDNNQALEWASQHGHLEVVVFLAEQMLKEKRCS